jgi:response regulator RpfG family c-di-GMP phosphodiesterase
MAWKARDSEEIMRKTYARRGRACVDPIARPGADLVSNIPFLAPTASILIATRERFDGTGFPFGLRAATSQLARG